MYRAAKVGEVGAIGAVARAGYAIAVVREGDHEGAKRFLDRVFARDARRAFLRAGFVTSSSDGKPIQ